MVLNVIIVVADWIKIDLYEICSVLIVLCEIVIWLKFHR